MPQANPNPVPPDRTSDKIVNKTETEITAPCRGPMAAAQARPPSNRKMGNKFNADAMRPEYPTMNSGWTGTGCAIGISIVLDDSHDKGQPTKKLDFNRDAGTTGNLAMSMGDACVVKNMPPMMYPKEARMPANGPLNAKSSSAARLDGNDFRGVMHPNSPNCGDGSGTGNPILIFLILATK